MHSPEVPEQSDQPPSDGPRRQFAIALRCDLLKHPPAGWQERVQRLSGVRLLGATSRRGQIETVGHTADSLREALGDELVIEELVARDVPRPGPPEL